VIAAIIFILMLVLVFMLRRPKIKMTLVFFAISMVCVTLLFLHHASDKLGLSF
jgi:hypothetical protein